MLLMLFRSNASLWHSLTSLCGWDRRTICGRDM